MNLAFLLAVFFFCLAFVTACGFGFLILRELRKGSYVQPRRVSPMPPLPAAPIDTSPPKPLQATFLPLAAAKPPPADNAKLYRQAPLSPAERAFLDFLTETTNGQYVIQTKVQLRDLFKRDGWLERELYTMHERGHVDFVLLDNQFKTPLLAIELDDGTHDRPERQDADRRKEIIFQRGDMQLLRFRKGVIWGEPERSRIRQALSQTHP